MKYINTFNEGASIKGVYLCKQKNSAVTKNGREYLNVTLADKTGTISCKIWDPNSMSIGDFQVNDYVDVYGKVSVFNGALQFNIDKAFKAQDGSFNPADYLPVSKRDAVEMWNELRAFISSVKTPCYKSLLVSFFGDSELADTFRKHSAAKMVHHGFVGGLMQHTLAVAKVCDFFATQYPLLDRDLIITAALLHDIGKTKELSAFPLNDYTDEGQLLGHIVIGTNMISERAAKISDFPEVKKNELLHCIVAHHGSLEFGSPKLPALMEAIALNMADNIDAKMELFEECINNSQTDSDWLGFNKFLDTNIRKTE